MVKVLGCSIPYLLPSVERLVDGTYHQHGWVSRAQTSSSVDVRCLVQALSKVRRRCSMKTAVGQNAQPECHSLQNSQPMEFTKQWGYAFWVTASLRKPNGRRHPRRTAAGLAAGRGYQREPSCSSPPCWQSVHEPRSAKHVVTEIAARSARTGNRLNRIWENWELYLSLCTSVTADAQ